MRDDNVLMNRTIDGDNSVYDELVTRHRLSAISFAYSFTKDIHTAEDIVQDCFVKIYIGRADYKASYEFSTYLFTLIRNKSIDFLRKNKPKRFVDLEAIEMLTSGQTPEEVSIQNERTSTIFTIIDKLQNNYKTALYLYAVHDLSYEQIAKIMQKSEAQIKITLFRGRKKLKTLMKGVLSDENE